MYVFISMYLCKWEKIFFHVSHWYAIFSEAVSCFSYWIWLITVIHFRNEIIYGRSTLMKSFPVAAKWWFKIKIADLTHGEIEPESSECKQTVLLLYHSIHINHLDVHTFNTIKTYTAPFSHTALITTDY